MRWVRSLRFSAVMCTLAAAFSFPTSSAFSVRHVLVLGNHALLEAEILRLAQLAPGTPLAQVDPEAVAQRLLINPRIRTAHVSIRFPDTVVLHVTERHPVVLVVTELEGWTVDEEGVVVGDRDEGLLPLLVEIPLPAVRPGARIPSERVRRVVRALAALPRGRILLARLDAEGDLYVQLVLGPWVRLRSEDDLVARLQIAEAVVRSLGQRGVVVASVDLRFRDQAVVRPRGRSPTSPVE